MAVKPMALEYQMCQDSWTSHASAEQLANEHGMKSVEESKLWVQRRSAQRYYQKWFVEELEGT